MKKIFTLVAAALMAVGAQAQVESYVAVTYDADANTYTASAEFAAVVADPTKGGEATNVENGKSIVKFGTANMDVQAVSGSNPNDVTGEPGAAFPGWDTWGVPKWDVKNQGDITYGYIGGSGNPYVEIGHEEVMTEGEPTGTWRPTYVYYGPKEETVGGKTYKPCLPVNGVYYKFSPKADGTLKINIWANKGNHNTYVMQESTLGLVTFTAEGYINGQKYTADNCGGDESLIGKMRYLTAEEIQAIHDAAKLQDLDGDGVKETDSAPYCIGAGNQPFWGTITFDVKGGQSYWVLQASSQVGFQKYEFTTDASAINNISVAPVKAVAKAIQNGRVVIVKGGNTFNIAGQLVK